MFAVIPLFQSNGPNLSYSLLENTNIIEITQSIPELKVQYRGVTVTPQNLSVRSVKIKVKNSGSRPLLQSEFDEELPWGVQFPGFEIIKEPQIVNASSAYIRDNLKPKIRDKDTLNLDKLILDPNSSFEVETTILSSNRDLVRLNILGKIAGASSTSNVIYIADQTGKSSSEVGLDTQISSSILVSRFSLALAIPGTIITYIYRSRRQLSSSFSKLLSSCVCSIAVVMSSHTIYLCIFTPLIEVLDHLASTIVLGLMAILFLSIREYIEILTTDQHMSG